jgi:hypothetical protein
LEKSVESGIASPVAGKNEAPVGKTNISDNLSIGPFSSLFGLNLMGLLVLGVAVSAWLLYYSDVFPEVAGLLGLGGAFAWVGFVLKLLRENRISDLQNWTDTTVFSSPRTTVVLSLLAPVLLTAGCFRGGIQLEPFQESLEHSVQIHGVGRPPSVLMHLPPSGQLRWNGWTCWWSPTKVAVKVSGYPEMDVEIHPWKRIPIYVPSSLLRPVVLLRPSVDLIDAVRDTSVTLELTIKEDGKPVARPRAAFDGHAVWIGADADILVPQETEARWHQELTDRKSEQHLAFWLPPLAPPQFNVTLRPGQEILAALRKKNNDIYATTNFRVESLRSGREFVQEEVLNVPSPVP